MSATRGSAAYRPPSHRYSPDRSISSSPVEPSFDLPPITFMPGVKLQCARHFEDKSLSCEYKDIDYSCKCEAKKHTDCSCDEAIMEVVLKIRVRLSRHPRPPAPSTEQ